MDEMETTEHDTLDSGDLFSLKDITSGLSSEGVGLDDHDMNDFQYDDEYSLSHMNNPMIMLMSSIMADGGQTGHFPASVTDLHALATANLISQTQEAIIQEYNINMDSPDIFGAEYTQLEPVIATEALSYSEVNDNNDNKDNFNLFETVSNKIVQDRKSLDELPKLPSEVRTCESSAETIKHQTTFELRNPDAITDNLTETVSDELKISSDNGSKITKRPTAYKQKREVLKTKDDVYEINDQSGDGAVCEQCGKAFRNKKGLYNHQTSHDPLCCPIPGCGRTFNYPSHYKYHILTHSQERNFNCECGKVFYTSQQLQVHARTHNYDKPFPCTHCDRSFSTAGNLKNHQRLHTGEKPYTCTVIDCSKSFAEISSLKKHLLTHSGEKPYKCEICNKRFTQTSSRSHHIRRKHPGQSDSQIYST